MQARRPASRRAFCPDYLLGIAMVACSGGAESRAAKQKPATGQADSLVLTTGAGTEVWFTLVRPATSGDGQQCVERGLEIRDQGKRTKVPLLYTGTAPDLINDTTMRAMLWKNCTPGDPYLVNLRTGQPVPERGTTKP